MRRKVTGLLVLAVMLMSAMAAAQAEEATEGASEVTSEAAERNYSPEAGTGWLTAQLGDETIELTYEGSTNGMTGKTYSFTSEDFDINLMLNKSLKAGETMEGNAITQIEVLSHETSSTGYYFIKKSSGTDVTSTVTLAETDDENILQGEFSVTVPSADRYVGDFKPGILPELEFTDGEFCFCEE